MQTWTKNKNNIVNIDKLLYMRNNKKYTLKNGENRERIIKMVMHLFCGRFLKYKNYKFLQHYLI